jgi:hypothetical protein
MRRLANPLSPALAGSTCLFRFVATVAGATAARELRLPHDLTDAFGGLLLVADLAARLGATFVPSLPPVSTGRCDDWLWSHYWVEAAPTAGDVRTLTQRVIGALTNAPLLESAGAWSVATAADELRDVPGAGAWGNSLAPVELDRDELRRLCAAPRAEWHAELATRGERALAALARRPSLAARRSRARVLVSSIGRLERLPWAPPVDPRSFVMAPTPSTPEMTTVVMWSRGPYQALTITGAATQAAVARADEIAACWREALA